MYKVLNTRDDEWNSSVDKLPKAKKDIYYTREYHMACENNGDGRAELFVYFDRNEFVIYPYLLNKIQGYDLEKEMYDIETCYGYGGPVGSSESTVFYSAFRKEFNEYCKLRGIVCEFIRFHPLMNNAEIKWDDIQVVNNRTTVSINLDKSLESIWKEQISSKNRNMIRKAEKNGVVVEEKTEIQIFRKIYNMTMDKVKATDYYYFSERYFEAFDKIQHFQLNVIREDKVIASSLFMTYGDYLHYHLSGSCKEELKYAPNNILLWEAIKRGKSKGCKVFHLGGGLTNSLEDSLYKFKKEFSKDTRAFYIGKCIHNEEIYKQLILKWEIKNHKKATLFLQYKY